MAIHGPCRRRTLDCHALRARNDDGGRVSSSVVLLHFPVIARSAATWQSMGLAAAARWIATPFGLAMTMVGECRRP